MVGKIEEDGGTSGSNSDNESWSVTMVGQWKALSGSRSVAGCAAQETSAQTLMKIERSTPSNLNSKFLGPAAPGLKQALELTHIFGSLRRIL